MSPEPRTSHAVPVATGPQAASAAAPAPHRHNPLWGEDWESVAGLWPLEASVTHLNHGSFGAVPEPVLDEQRSWRARMEANPVRFFAREVADALATARGEVAAFLGLGGEDDIAFVPNATTGMSTVLAAAGLGAGDEVLLTDAAYGAVRIAADRFCADTGARVRVVAAPLDAGDDELVEAVLGGVTPRTRLVVVDHVTSATARRMPVERLVPAVQELGVAVCVDAAHAPGMLPLALGALAPDYWVGNLHKWACAPRGTAVLHVAPRRRSGVRPLVASWRDELGFPRAFDLTGTTDVSAWLSAPAALRLLGRLGWDRIRDHNARLAAEGQSVLAGAVRSLGHDGTPLSRPGDDRLPMRLVALDPAVVAHAEDAARLQRCIAEVCAVEVAVTAAAGRGFLRLSAQVYNCPADYAVLAERIARVLPDQR